MKHRIFLALALGALVSAGVSASGRFEGSIQTTWDYPAGIQTLVVDADRQDLVIKAGGPRVTGRLIGENTENAKVTRDGATLTITVRSAPAWFSFGTRSARVELSVPPGIALDLTTASGAILVEVPSNSLKALSGSGDIEAPRGTGTAEVNSDSGTVRLKAFSGPVRAATLSGDLVLEGLTGNIVASTMSGKLRGTDLAPQDKSRFTTVSGDADLRLRGGAGAYKVRTETVSGEGQIGDSRGGQTLAAGTAGPEIRVQAVSGDIQVR